MDAVIYGATGFTGRLIARALSRHGIAFAIAGRDPARLQAMQEELGGEHEIRPASVHDAAALAEALSGARVVINCAGPFSRLGEPVVKAAIEAGAHYIDTTGEQAFMREIFERYESAARRAGVCVLNSFAFEIALGDWAAELAAQALPGPPLDELSVCYAVEDFKTTTGTRLSIVASLESPACIWKHDRWVEVPAFSSTRPVTFPAPFGLREALSFPSGEVITVPRHVEVETVQTFVSFAGDSPLSRAVNRGAALVGPLLGALMQSPLGALARAKLGDLSQTPSSEQRRASRFSVVARAERSHERREVSVSGIDPYGVTAEVVAYGAAGLLEGRVSAAGVLAPSEAFDAQGSLAELAERAELTVVRGG